MKRQNGIKLVSTTGQVKNGDTEKKQKEGQTASLEIDDRLEP